MELRARLFPFGDATHRALASVVPPESLRWQSSRCAVDFEDARLSRILEAGDTAKGFGVSGESVFSAAELGSVTHFELVCRAIARETDRDFQANDAVRQRTRPIDAGGERPIVLLAGLFLSRVRLKPNMVGSVGDWTQEYVIGSGIAEVITRAGWTGVTLLPITNPRTGAAYTEYFQIFSKALLPPAIVDCSVERIRSRYPDDDGSLRHLGCLVYERSALLDRPDFNRTAEPWGGAHGWPVWVVSARVEQTLKKAHLRGWHFRPVLTSGSDLYTEYVSKWTRLLAAVSASTRSKMDGGRW